MIFFSTNDQQKRFKFKEILMFCLRSSQNKLHTVWVFYCYHFYNIIFYFFIYIYFLAKIVHHFKTKSQYIKLIQILNWKKNPVISDTTAWTGGLTPDSLINVINQWHYHHIKTFQIWWTSWEKINYINYYYNRNSAV